MWPLESPCLSGLWARFLNSLELQHFSFLRGAGGLSVFLGSQVEIESLEPALKKSGSWLRSTHRGVRWSGREVTNTQGSRLRVAEDGFGCCVENRIQLVPD